MKKKLLIVIPARSGSTRVKNKNMKRLGSIPLLGHKIKTCIKSQVGRVIVSTNSRKIANYAKKLGAEVPFCDQRNIQQRNHQRYHAYYI